MSLIANGKIVIDPMHLASKVKTPEPQKTFAQTVFNNVVEPKSFKTNDGSMAFGDESAYNALQNLIAKKETCVQETRENAFSVVLQPDLSI